MSLDRYACQLHWLVKAYDHNAAILVIVMTSRIYLFVVRIKMSIINSTEYTAVRYNVTTASSETVLSKTRMASTKICTDFHYTEKKVERCHTWSLVSFLCRCLLCRTSVFQMQRVVLLRKPRNGLQNLPKITRSSLTEKWWDLFQRCRVSK